MTPVLIVSLLDPVFWGFIWFAIWCAYRLPKWSWIKLLFPFLWIGGLAGIMVLQAHLWQYLEPQGTNHRLFDQVLYPEIISGSILMFWRLALEDRAMKQRTAVNVSGIVGSQTENELNKSKERPA
jgi:hypothetical protein